MNRSGGGKVSASGGNGFGGGGGGRVAVDVFSWHDEPHILSHGKIIFCYIFFLICFFLL